MMNKANHVIVTYGGGETLDQVFNAIATMFNDNEFSNAIYISAVLFGFWVIINGIAKGSAFIPIKWFMWFIISTNLVLYPKTTIMIKDPLTKYQRTVANVPYLLGSFAATMSSIGHVFTEKMETFFTLPDYLSYHKTGSVFASKLFGQMGQYRIRDGVLKANLHRFIQNCVVYDAMVGVKYDLKDLQNSNDILSLIANTSNIVGFTYQEHGNNGSTASIVSCKEGIVKLKEKMAGEANLLAGVLGRKFGVTWSTMDNQEQQGAAVPGQVSQAVVTELKSNLVSSYHFMSKISAEAETILKQEMMINAIQDATKNKAEELGSPHTYAATKALLQQRSAYNTVGAVAAQTLAVTKVIFEVLTYTAFIFVAMMVMMPNGLQVLINYLGLIMWIQLWPPLYAVLNLVINVAASYRSQGLIGSEGLTMITSVGFANLHADMEAMAGYLSMSIPFISYAIVKGGAGSFMNLAGSLSSNFQFAASAASEVSSGNLSMRNLSYATSSMNSTSGFKHDTNYSHQSGRVESGYDDGSIGFSTASGASGFRAGSGLTTSNWGTQLNLQSHLSAMNAQAMQYEQSNINNLSHEYSSAESQAFRQSSALLERMAKSGGQNRSWSVGGSTEQSAGISQTVGFMQELQNRYGYNTNQAAEVTAGIGVGTGKGLGSGSMGGSFRSQSEYQDAVSKGKQLADNLGYTENLQKAVRHMDQVSFSENEQFEKGLSRDLSSSLDRMDAIRDSIGTSQQHLQRYSSSQSFIDNQGAGMNVDINQKYVEWLAGQKTHVNGNVHSIGMSAARKIAMQQDDVNAAYTKQFFGEAIPMMAATLPNTANTGLQHSNFNPNGIDNGSNHGNAPAPVKGSNDNMIGKELRGNNYMSGNQPEAAYKGEANEQSIASEAKSWSSVGSMFTGNSNETKFDSLNNELVQAHKSGQPNISSLPDSKEMGLEQGKNRIPSSTGLEMKHNNLNQKIQNVEHDFSAKFSNEFNDNVSTFNKVNDNKAISEGIIESVQSHYEKSPETMHNKSQQIISEKTNLGNDYEDNNKQTQIEKAIRGVAKDEKK